MQWMMNLLIHYCSMEDCRQVVFDICTSVSPNLESNQSRLHLADDRSYMQARPVRGRLIHAHARPVSIHWLGTC
jgi:hypothetical protein